MFLFFQPCFTTQRGWGSVGRTQGLPVVGTSLGHAGNFSCITHLAMLSSTGGLGKCSQVHVWTGSLSDWGIAHRGAPGGWAVKGWGSLQAFSPPLPS